jgi:Flp pilus assembly protein TadG
MVEAAMTLPFLLLILFATIEFSFYFQSYFAARNAVSVGADVATNFHPDCNATILGRVQTATLVTLEAADLPSELVTSPTITYPRGVANLCGDDPEGLVTVQLEFAHRMRVLSNLLPDTAFPLNLPIVVSDIRRDFN